MLAHHTQAFYRDQSKRERRREGEEKEREEEQSCEKREVRARIEPPPRRSAAPGCGVQAVQRTFAALSSFAAQRPRTLPPPRYSAGLPVSCARPGRISDSPCIGNAGCSFCSPCARMEKPTRRGRLTAKDAVPISQTLAPGRLCRRLRTPRTNPRARLQWFPALNYTHFSVS